MLNIILQRMEFLKVKCIPSKAFNQINIFDIICLSSNLFSLSIVTSPASHECFWRLFGESIWWKPSLSVLLLPFFVCLFLTLWIFLLSTLDFCLSSFSLSTIPFVNNWLTEPLQYAILSFDSTILHRNGMAKEHFENQTKPTQPALY